MGHAVYSVQMPGEMLPVAVVTTSSTHGMPWGASASSGAATITDAMERCKNEIQSCLDRNAVAMRTSVLYSIEIPPQAPSEKPRHAVEERLTAANFISWNATASRARRPGVSIVEVLAVAAVVAIMGALIVPSVSRARRAGLHQKCSRSIAGVSALFHAYAADYQDAIPFGGYEKRHSVAPSPFGFVIGGDAYLFGGAWSGLFQDHWSGDRWDRALVCPRQPIHNPAGKTIRDGLIQAPCYFMSDALCMDAARLTAESDWKSWKPRANRVADVTFPSSKVSVFEQIAFCAEGPGVDEATYDIGCTSAFSGSVALMDGSAQRRVRDDDLGSCGELLPYYVTVMGVNGRDLLHR